jgi:DNA-directed RNA polymerase specialized sigma24 family protein
MSEAAKLCLEYDELMSVGLEAAVAAENSWISYPQGKSLSSWVYLKVGYAIQKELFKTARWLTDEESDDWPDYCSTPETRMVVSDALKYLEAKLTKAEWWLLLMYYGEGYTPRELSEKLHLSYGRVRNKLSETRFRAVTLLQKTE